MNKLEAMRIFMRVADLSSFSLAGKQLNKSPAAITRNVAMLEAQLNVRLMNRSTRSLSLTEAGKVYLDGCRAVTNALDAVESGLVRSAHDHCGVLRIASPAVFATTGLASLLAAYRAMAPRVDFDVTTYDAPIDVIEGGFDVCFSTDRYPISNSLVRRPLMTIKETLVASPAYLANRGKPDAPAVLQRHDLLTERDGSRSWEFADAIGVKHVLVNSILSATSCDAVRSAALANMGIALLPIPLVADDIAKGRLVPLLERFQINGGPQHIALVYYERRCLTAKVRSFIDFVLDRFQEPVIHDSQVTLRVVA
jgi:DNA-binding transcriptional LysR family regulator